MITPDWFLKLYEQRNTLTAEEFYRAYQSGQHGNERQVWESWPWSDDSAGAEQVRTLRWRMKDHLYADWEQAVLKLKFPEITNPINPQRESQTRN